MILAKLKVGALTLVAAMALAVPPLIAYQGAKPSDVNQGKPAALTQPTNPPRVEPRGEMIVTSEREVAADQAQGPGGPTPLQAQMVQMARTALNVVEQDSDNGPVTRMLWGHRLAEAEVAAARSVEAKVKAVQDHLDRLARIAADQTPKFVAMIDNPQQTIRNKVDSEIPRFWTTAGQIEAALAEARQWQEQLQPKPAAPVASPAPGQGGGGGGFGGGFMGGGGTVPRPAFTPLPKASAADEKQNQAILTLLERRVPMKFPNDTPLSDIILHVKQATIDKASGFPAGIPIYVDPQGLQDADKTMGSTVALDLEGIELRTTLRLLLRQLNLTYIVENGLMIVASPNNDSDFTPYFDGKPQTPAPVSVPVAGGFN